MVNSITSCRLCGNTSLTDVVHLGEQALTGVFPNDPNTHITKGPLTLTLCDKTLMPEACGLLQLKQSYPLQELYGQNYGYRSGLNSSMVAHLHQKISSINQFFSLDAGDIVIDIGSNDATSLKAYPKKNLCLIGIDPSAEKFSSFYTDDMIPVFDFFSAERIKSVIGNKKAKVVTAFSMFYDLENPLSFAREVASILADDGIWVCEQSYMPRMVEQLSFDTICHEHLEYYGLYQLQWIAENAGLKILDVEFNEINGGSVSLTFAKRSSSLKANANKINSLIYHERLLGYDTPIPYLAFADRVRQTKLQIRHFFECIHSDNKSIYGLGASTKGNVLLQYCDITTKDLPAIGEVNKDKFGSFTPGSLIPIVPESEVIESKPDYLFVLPWHFKSFFIENVSLNHTQWIFPLPSLSII